jgi:hypothetical protein
VIYLTRKSSLLSFEADLTSPSAGIKVSSPLPPLPNRPQDPKYPFHCILTQIHSISHNKQSICSGNKIAYMFLQSQCHSGKTEYGLESVMASDSFIYELGPYTSSSPGSQQ